MNILKKCVFSTYLFTQCCLPREKTLIVGSSGLSVRAPSQNLCRCVREEREVDMGSSSSSYAPKTIYLDVDGKVQKVGPIPAEIF